MPTIRKAQPKMKPNEVCPCDENMELDTPVKYRQCCRKKAHNQEQKGRELMYANQRIVKAKQQVAEAIQHDIDHPIILPDSQQPGPKIILP